MDLNNIVFSLGVGDKIEIVESKDFIQKSVRKVKISKGEKTEILNLEINEWGAIKAFPEEK